MISLFPSFNQFRIWRCKTSYGVLKPYVPIRLDCRSMTEEGNCESAPAGPSSTPAVGTATPEPKLEMSSYMKQLMAEKHKLEAKAGLDLQLAHRLLTNGE